MTSTPPFDEIPAVILAGGRKIDNWYARHRLALADFSAWPDTFLDLNTPVHRRELEWKFGV